MRTKKIKLIRNKTCKNVVRKTLKNDNKIKHMDTIIKYHKKYLKSITKFRFDPIALLIALIIVLTFFDDVKAVFVTITYLLVLTLAHLPLIIYKNYKKINKKTD